MLERNSVETVYIAQAYGLTGGEAVLQQCMGLAPGNIQRFLAHDAVGDSIVALRSVRNDLLALNDASISQQQLRMADEALYGIARPLEQYRKDIQRSMISAGDGKKGYIMWLDFLPGKPKKQPLNAPQATPAPPLPAIELLCPQPFHPRGVLDRMKEIEAALKDFRDSDEEEGGGAARVIGQRKKKGQKKDPLPKNFKKMFLGAKLMSAAARGSLADVKENVIELLPLGVDFAYDKRAITQTEYEWFEARSSHQKVLELAAAEYDTALQSAWEALPTSVLSEEAIARQSEVKAQAEEKAKAIATVCKAMLVRKKMSKHTRENGAEQSLIVEMDTNASREAVAGARAPAAAGKRAG
ncbi:hypothetical protein B484DRAFT_461043, partial [Ochromonadaceae sp. CCMP2298]